MSPPGRPKGESRRAQPAGLPAEASPRPPPGLRAWLQIDTPRGRLLGAQRIGLLEAIDRHGSIAQAAKAVGMGYKAAWDAMDDMNRLAPEALVRSVSGGVRGGGTALTDYGRRLVAYYRALDAESQGAAARLEAALADGLADTPAQFAALIRRPAILASARNQFIGRVHRLSAGPVEALVELELARALILRAVVTAEALARMRLREGDTAHAFVKSSSVFLTDLAPGSLSVGNHFPGRVQRIHRGPVNAQVEVAIDGGPMVLSAVVTDDSVSRMQLAVGAPLAACFKASSVILAVAT